uniref:Receptor-binding cancer antigen expressed on SiSo cells n=1 Tax=Cyanistes caeruleus TaxID=156563 RepID=A0A8C0VLD4_CYACU
SCEHNFRFMMKFLCLADFTDSRILHFFFRSGRGRKLSGDQITLPTTVDYSSVPKQPEVEDWSSWDEDAPTSVKIEGGNGNVAAQQNSLEQMEPDYFKDMTPTIRKTQKVSITLSTILMEGFLCFKIKASKLSTYRRCCW